jgi:Domain of unknown function (DUF222)
MYERLVEVRGQLAELVTAVDPDAVSGSTARMWWAEFDRVERLAAAGKTLLARRVAATHRADRSGSRTAAEELARKAGTTAGTAKDAVDTSHRLPDQPELDQAVRRGEVSPPQAALVSAAAAADPSAEQRLVELAPRVSLAELREECARVKAAADPDPEATNRRIHAQRRLRHYRDGEGGWNLSARGTAHAGAAFVTVLNAITDATFTAARRAGRHESVEAYAFDALMAMAEHAAESTTTADPEAGGDGAGSVGRAGDPGIVAAGEESRPGCAVPPRPSTSPRYLGLLRVDVAALRRGRVQGGELCEVAGVGPIPVSGAKELLGEAIVKLVITDGLDVLSVTHLGRGPTAAQRAALLWMNPSCSVVGCHRTRVEWDHREPWAQTRHTRLDGLDPLCSFHHDLKTRLGWALAPGKGKRAFVPPDDPRHPGYGRPPGEQPRPDAAATGSPTRPGAAAAPPGRAGPPRTTRQAAAAQMTLPDPLTQSGGSGA